MDPIRDLLCRFPSGDKTFWHFRFRAGIDISSTLRGTNWIKYKILKWTPSGSALADSLRGIGSAFADSLRGIKHFQNFKTGDNDSVF